MIVLIIGLPGSGKTSLAKELSERTNSIHLNADEIRADLNSDLGFSHEDRIENARSIGAIARLLSSQGLSVIVDFVCPTKETRDSFGHFDFLIWMDRIKEGRYEDTNKMWEEPIKYDLRIKNNLTIEKELELVLRLCKLHDWRKPTTLMLGRYQPWHPGHSALYEEATKRTEQVLVGVRDTYMTSEKDPFEYKFVKEKVLESEPKAMVLKLPNITNIVYGRDVGYSIEKVFLGEEIEQISATEIRKKLLNN